MRLPSFIGPACRSKVAEIVLVVMPVSFFTPVVGAQEAKGPGGFEFTGQDAGEGSRKAPVGRTKPPLPLEQAAARKLVRDTYAADFAAKSAARQKSLAALLLDQAYGERDQITRFVLLSEAVTAFAKGGDISAAFSTIGKISRSWIVDVFELKRSALQAFSPSKKPDFYEQEVTGEAYLDLIDTAIEKDRFKEAVAVSDDALKISSKLGGRKFKAGLKDRKARAQMLAGAFDGLRSQYLRLLDDPNDPAANLAVGNFYIDTKKDPKAAVPFLAKAPGSPLQEISQADVAASSGGGSRYAVGEGWADLYLAGRKKRSEFRDRALYWYKGALAISSGLKQTRILQRIRDFSGDGRGQLRPLKVSEYSALVWKGGESGHLPASFSALKPTKKGPSIVMVNPSDDMYSYLVCDFDAAKDFYLKCTVRGVSEAGILGGSRLSISGRQVRFRSATTVVIERSNGELSFYVGNKKTTPQRFGYGYGYYGGSYGRSSGGRSSGSSSRSSSSSDYGSVFFRLPRRKICYLSAVQFYQAPELFVPGSRSGSNIKLGDPAGNK